MDEATLLARYATMLRMRRFDEMVDRLYAAGKLYGTIHLYIGQEAVGAGVCGELVSGDAIASTHRGHGHNIAMGGDLGAMMAELLGRETGSGHGRGGSMHIADQERGNLGANGIVGAGIPLAAGAALSFQLNGSSNVAVAFMGDGALNEGCVHEGLNLAAVWRLPAVFVIENNQYGLSGPVREMYGIERLAQRAAAYGMPGTTVDGQDLEAVAAAARTAIERARDGAGPTLLEMLTYRFKGHSKNDPGKYRAREELEAWRKRDPLSLLAERLARTGVDAGHLQDVAAKVEAEIQAAVAFAEASPYPDPARLLGCVYAAGPTA